VRESPTLATTAAAPSARVAARSPSGDGAGTTASAASVVPMPRWSRSAAAERWIAALIDSTSATKAAASAARVGYASRSAPTAMALATKKRSLEYEESSFWGRKFPVSVAEPNFVASIKS